VNNKDKPWLWKVLVSLDQLANNILDPALTWLTGVKSVPDETISSRLGKAVTLKKKDCRLCVWTCNLINVFDPRWWARDGFDHCKDSIERDEGESL
jgi:hypothetical protein